MSWVGVDNRWRLRGVGMDIHLSIFFGLVFWLRSATILWFLIFFSPALIRSFIQLLKPNGKYIMNGRGEKEIGSL